MRISMVAALDDERGIGKDNTIPWNLHGEQLRFKALTMGHPIIMGRKTFESLKRPLPGRTNIIVTRNPDYAAPEGCIIAHSLAEALGAAKKLDNEEIFIIGGTALYDEGLTVADRLYLTKVAGAHGADTFFPEYEHAFKQVTAEEPVTDGRERYQLTVYERRA
jgi:dihydrofolate reductase